MCVLGERIVGSSERENRLLGAIPEALDLKYVYNLVSNSNVAHLTRSFLPMPGENSDLGIHAQGQGRQEVECLHPGSLLFWELRGLY